MAGSGLGLSSTPASFWPIQNTCIPEANVQLSEPPVAPGLPSLQILISEVTMSLCLEPRPAPRGRKGGWCLKLGEPSTCLPEGPVMGGSL